MNKINLTCVQVNELSQFCYLDPDTYDILCFFLFWFQPPSLGLLNLPCDEFSVLFTFDFTMQVGLDKQLIFWRYFFFFIFNWMAMLNMARLMMQVFFVIVLQYLRSSETCSRKMEQSYLITVGKKVAHQTTTKLQNSTNSLPYI